MIEKVNEEKQDIKYYISTKSAGKDRRIYAVMKVVTNEYMCSECSIMKGSELSVNEELTNRIIRQNNLKPNTTFKYDSLTITKNMVDCCAGYNASPSVFLSDVEIVKRLHEQIDSYEKYIKRCGRIFEGR